MTLTIPVTSLHSMLTVALACWLLVGGGVTASSVGSEPLSISGVYPHLAYWNPHGECGAGAVVPWAGKLWVISYAPHFPQGSADKLYRIEPDLSISTFEGSVGGTPANRMIHRESNQLLIGPYLIDKQGSVRVIPPERMYGRLTGTARHLFDPENKVYYATMEEGVYEVDVRTLEVTELFQDDQNGAHGGVADAPVSDKPFARLPGYHGKGLYSGQGRLIYANNGEASSKARQSPDTPSGCLAEWDGKSDQWKVIRRNQFTDVRGPGGLYGNALPSSDPVWAIGWDHRSLLLMLLDNGQWSTYRLPKASHTYDGAHGWNTEWPRIHDLGDEALVMNMHGMFWRFPRTFCRQDSSGIEPRTTYLKVVGDYCRWKDRLVFGCDDTAKNEFLNTRRAKGDLCVPGMSHSNLWFTDPDIMDSLGPAIGRGAVWSNDEVKAHTPSDPFLFAGFKRRGLHLEHDGDQPVTFFLEIDRRGNDQWTDWGRIEVTPGEAVWRSFDATQAGVWVRLSTDRDCPGVSAQFHYSAPDDRPTHAAGMFTGIAASDTENASGGTVRVRGEELKTLAFAARQAIDGELSEPIYYELDAELRLRRASDTSALAYTVENCSIPEGVLAYDAASVVYVDDDGRRRRLPRGAEGHRPTGVLGSQRVDREVVTERDLFNAGGLFYELPARNAGGFARIRPITTHNRQINDYCSYRGLLIMTGVEADASTSSGHIIRSDDGRVALWAGVVDDLWGFGKATGVGGPWLDTPVAAGEQSDAFLMTGFDKKTLILAHDAETPVGITLQLDIDGDGTWVDYHTYLLRPGKRLVEQLPEGLSAYWVRAVCDRDGAATVQFRYE